jgi:hypothetical protein
VEDQWRGLFDFATGGEFPGRPEQLLSGIYMRLRKVHTPPLDSPDLQPRKLSGSLKSGTQIAIVIIRVG